MVHSIHFKPSSINTLRNVGIVIAPLIVVIVIVALLPLDDFWHSLPTSIMKWQAVGIFQFLFVLCIYPIVWIIGKIIKNGDYLDEIQLIYGILFAESLATCLLVVFSQVLTR
ncbi:MAG: hypothetical protein CO170_04565 [candidate division SR1 bacterium CG_4_9_14_3_um_filter_40_9]|nr:MAG: hypothetical protein CO170_04565 [candidate division SR1 bacterium CG_4_9_14_3_um_filter_40_9]